MRSLNISIADTNLVETFCYANTMKQELFVNTYVYRVTYSHNKFYKRVCMIYNSFLYCIYLLF